MAVLHHEASVTINCRDPYGFTRVVTPVRGKNCKHIQCFDLGIYLELAIKRGINKCLHCNQHIPLQHLRICPIMKKVLSAVSPQCTSVRLMQDGSFKEADNA